jgi:hypothetical protein
VVSTATVARFTIPSGACTGPRPHGKWVVGTEFVEDTYDYAADLVTTATCSSNRLDQDVQRQLIVTSVQRREGPGEIWHRRALEPDPCSETIRRHEHSKQVRNKGSNFRSQRPSCDEAGVTF